MDGKPHFTDAEKADAIRRWKTRIRAWASTEPLPISEADEDELHALFGFAYVSQDDPNVCWFGDPHFSQRMRVQAMSATADARPCLCMTTSNGVRLICDRHRYPLMLDELPPITYAHWTYLAERADWQGYRYRCCE